MPHELILPHFLLLKCQSTIYWIPVGYLIQPVKRRDIIAVKPERGMYCRALTSHLTHYRSFRGRFITGQITKTNSVKALKETSRSWRSGLNTTRNTPLCYNNTTLCNHLYAQRKGPNVTNPTCLTCKNCSHKCAADCEHCLTQSSTELF